MQKHSGKFTVNYDPEQLIIYDLAGQLGGQQTAAGDYENLRILSATDGCIQFEWLDKQDTLYYYNYDLTILRFQTLKAGNTTVSVQAEYR